MSEYCLSDEPVNDNRDRYTKKGYAVGEKNGLSKITNDDVCLIIDLHDSYMEDLAKIEQEMENLKARKAEIKRNMRRSVIADMFGISEGHCSRLINGDSRGNLISINKRKTASK